MTERLERGDVIRLLEKLGSDEDEEVLAAAREVHDRVSAAGTTWEDLLVPDEAVAADGEDRDAADDSEAPAYDAREDEGAEAAGAIGGKNAEAVKLIDKLLAQPGISEETREELRDYKTDISEGEFTEADRRYIRALSNRLSKRR